MLLLSCLEKYLPFLSNLHRVKSEEVLVLNTDLVLFSKNGSSIESDILTDKVEEETFESDNQSVTATTPVVQH